MTTIVTTRKVADDIGIPLVLIKELFDGLRDLRSEYGEVESITITPCDTPASEWEERLTAPSKSVRIEQITEDDNVRFGLEANCADCAFWSGRKGTKGVSKCMMPKNQGMILSGCGIYTRHDFGCKLFKINHVK